jgi:hypothetical protein
MDLLKKIKIELWVLCLVGLLSLLLAIGTGILVRQELVGSFKLGGLSKAALFLAEIPVNMKRILSNETRVGEQRFPNVSGFQGKPLEDEMYLLLAKYDGDITRSVVELIDLKTFSVKKTWSPDVDQINGLVDTSHPEFENIQRDNNVKMSLITHPFLTEDGGLIFRSNFSPLIKINNNSELVWQNQEDIFHHSIEEDHEGNFWVATSVYPYQVDKRYVGLEFGNYEDDAITKVSEDGKILFQKSISNIFLENNLEFVYSNGTQMFISDPIHLNDIQPVLSDGPHWKRGDVFLSMRHQSMVILYRPSTNKIIWKGMGNTSARHDVDILDDHRISIFDNNVKDFFTGEQVDDHNEVVIYDFNKDSYSKYLDESLEQYNVRTVSGGRSQILDNGDLFIEEQNYGRLLFFNKDGSLQWQFINRANNGNLYVLNWSRILYKPEDIKKVHKILEIED